MNRHIFVLSTLASVLVMAQAAPAGARQTAPKPAEAPRKAIVEAQVPKPQIVIPPIQIDEQALEELARSQAVLALDRAKLAGVLAGDVEMKARLAVELAGQVGQGIGKGSGVWAEQFGADRERAYYDRGMSALDSGKWQGAIDAFDQVIKAAGTKTDGAMYWKAYAQNRVGQRSEALQTLDELLKKFPASRWVAEAKALQVEVRPLVGQPVRPEQESDEDLKLIAINSLLHSDPERTVPMLEQLLKGHDSPRVKERALFVLAQSATPRAKDLIVQIAKGGANPDLQLKAVRYLGIYGGEGNRQILMDIYKSSNDIDVKRQILQTFMVAGERGRVYAVAKGEPVLAIRRDAVNQLGVMNAEAELWQLYQSESSPDLKKQIIQALFIGGSADKLMELAKTEKDVELRKTAVRNLGMMSNKKTGDALTSVYKAEKDESVKKAAIQGLFVQENATALIDIARSETNPALKKDVVEKLSMMKSKEATDYLLELLKK